MKNLLVKSIASLLLIIFFVANSEAQTRVKGNGKVINKTRNVGSFDKVGVAGSFDVFLVKGDEGKIDIEIEDNLLPHLVTSVEKGKLKIKWKKGVNIRSTKTTIVTVHFNKINSVGLSGSGDIVSKDKIKSNDFSVALSGSGDIDMKVETTQLKAAVSGSGDIDLKGTAKDFNAAVAGSGDINAYGLKVDTADLKISGSGGMTITVSNKITARIAGSGNITYKGDPKIDVKISGSGNVSSY
jgi:putative autotransporter adhesin-like protein